MRVELTRRSDYGTERFEILLGGIVYVISLEEGKRLADWIYELHPTAKAENEALREGIERLEFLSHLTQGIPTTPNDRLCLIGEEASALLTKEAK